MLIDVQYDFICGSLHVNGAADTMNNLVEYIRENGKTYEFIILTVDWHPFSHCSFKINGGMWPVHCQQYTQGAAIYQPIIDVLNEIGVEYHILQKGINDDHEEYSIFKNFESKNRIDELVGNFSIDEIDICGIAFDFCVADSCKDGLRALPNINFNVIRELSPSIGDGKEFIDFVNNSERIKWKQIKI